MSNKKDILSAKHDAAVALGKLGGLARAKNLSAERRKEIAVNAAKARWTKNAKRE